MLYAIKDASGRLIFRTLADRNDADIWRETLRYLYGTRGSLSEATRDAKRTLEECGYSCVRVELREIGEEK